MLETIGIVLFVALLVSVVIVTAWLTVDPDEIDQEWQDVADWKWSNGDDT